VYKLEFAHRKSLGITVTPEMDVVVKAPHNATLARVTKLVEKRVPWILKQQDYFLAFYPKQIQKRFVSGEIHLYLGRQYRLQVGIGKVESVRLIGKNINVVCRRISRVQKLLMSWYLHQAKLKFDLFKEDWIERFKKHRVAPSSVLVRAMSRRWGSCTPQGKIILNTELIKAPRGCIEYVIVHELCHLIHRNHTRKFIELQSRELPMWETWKMRLEKILA
jgi:predicted metal-dependent hydrolase